ncbi:glycoside hydrolase family 85 protein [Zopfia rhizophila CBS 207.26]|uniref:Glycoside hydrolase family 85 protein n=1 Tax=Zopfia rhizophila CBS 207.26 TaxID=1314779 RepID=A0A6A6DYM0_9PEZI|nr:glycoside hydrolase family 85 protein [Zopfia rhizophila CBS 207.26]
MNVLGWKDILRPIRDGYRHLFPSPDTGLTPEERRRQRGLDRLKGFTYFDTFEQLENWTEEESDPLQRANTPLLQRPQLNEKDKKGSASLLLCHDYSGNYHEYENSQGAGVDEESYSCEYLQFIDTFIYFSHKLACVPPPSWTNTLHRNGVRALGTFLVEPQTNDIERLLHHERYNDSEGERLNFPTARRLSDIAKHYGFDGWLINIEKPFPKEEWNNHTLSAFLEQLNENLGLERKIIWPYFLESQSQFLMYDAITVANKVDYQNALTPLNISFSQACGSILTNYCWKEEYAWNSKLLAQQNHILPGNVYFGVDVWAQNKVKLNHPRVTYPEKGGGGTNTGIAVTKLAEVDLSVGIFAPAWSFEHFPGRGRAVERAMWDGGGLPDDVTCTCGKASQCHPPNRGYSITRSARGYPAGSESFFYSDFKRGFARHRNRLDQIYGGKKLHSQLGSQSVLPHMSRPSVWNDDVENGINILSKRLEDLPERTQLVVEVESVMSSGHTLEQMYERWIPLFKLDMLADESLQLKIRSRYPLRIPGASASYYLKFTTGRRLLPLREVDRIQTTQAAVIPGPDNWQTGRLREIGVHLQAPPLIAEEPVRAVEIMDVCIIPRSAVEHKYVCSINDIRIENRRAENTEHWRLCWTYRVEEWWDDKVPGTPYSEITGPFSHFLISVDGLSVGRAYALEYILCQSLVNVLAGEGVEVTVTGVGFDGRRLADRTMHLHV